MGIRFKDGCRECLRYLKKQKKRLMRKRVWSKKDGRRYEDLDAFSCAVRGALETVEFYEQREAVLKDRIGEEALEEVNSAWLELRKAEINEHLGITPGTDVEQQDMDEKEEQEEG